MDLSGYNYLVPLRHKCLSRYRTASHFDAYRSQSTNSHFSADNNIVHVIVQEGTEIDNVLAKSYSDAVVSLIDSPSGLLVDKRNRYSLTFAAQYEYFNKIPNVVATALWVNGKGNLHTARSQLPMLNSPMHKVEIFTQESEAINWLKAQIAESSNV